MIIAPILFYSVIVAMPQSKWMIGVASIGLGLLGLMFYDLQTHENLSGDPHAGIGRALGYILLFACAAGWALACILQLIRRVFQLSIGSYIAAAVIAPIVLISLSFLFVR